MVYVMNPCETVTCSNTEVSLYQGLEILGELTPNCDVLTNASPPVYSFIDEHVPSLGVEWKFSGIQI